MQLNDGAKSIYDLLAGWTAVVTGMGAFVALFAMLALFAAGLAEIGLGVADVAQGWRPGGTHAAHSAVVTRVIAGVEMLLLAPMAYFVFFALGKYLQRPKDDAGSRRAHAELLEVKAFITGIFFAVVATNGVGRALESKLDYEASLSSAVLMTVLAAYFIFLERLAAEDRNATKEKNPGGGPSPP